MQPFHLIGVRGKLILTANILWNAWYLNKIRNSIFLAWLLVDPNRESSTLGTYHLFLDAIRLNYLNFTWDICTERLVEIEPGSAEITATF